jgi:hypothetical protein
MAISDTTAGARPGLPDPNSIISQKTFVPRQEAPAGPSATRGARPTYRILRTNEVDPYDPPMARAAVPAIAPLGVRPPGDSFKGTSRKAAKLAVVGAGTETFNDLRSLIAGLPKDTSMVAHKPKISTAVTSNRVAKEKRNVRVRAFLYAASREEDNDFHLIIGRNPTKSPVMYMTVELSGLPPKTSQHFDRLKAARDAYKAFFADDMPGMSYDFYDPPIPVEVEGSLFFDMSHATGSKPGPNSLRDDIPTIWEIHPISRIVFEP